MSAERHDHKGYSEEKCLRCGWVMGQAPLNCNNDGTPHRFPSGADAIELLADFGDAVRKQTDEYDEAEVRRSWPDAPILAIFDLLIRLDALCGDER